MLTAAFDIGIGQIDSLHKLLKNFGVELVSIEATNYDDPAKQINSDKELTICAKDPKTLGAAMVKLSELGLPFKKRIDHWYPTTRPTTKPPHIRAIEQARPNSIKSFPLNSPTFSSFPAIQASSVASSRTASSTDSEGWTKVKKPADIFLIDKLAIAPQRRMSDVATLPKLRIDTSYSAQAKKPHSTDTPTAPATPTVPESAIRRQLIGETASLGSHGYRQSDEILNTYELQRSHPGSFQAGFQYSGAMDNSRAEMGNSFSVYPISGTSFAPPSITDAAPSIGHGSPTRSQHFGENSRFGQGRFQNTTAPSAFQENSNPRTSFSGYGGGFGQNGGYRQGYNNGFPRPTASAGFVPRANPGSEAMKDFNMMDGFFSYTLKPIPLTGPRFIR